MPAAWLENYLPASYRGIKFFVESHTHPMGRTKHLHYFPYRDLPDVEDVREDVKPFPIQAYMIKDNYFDDRNALINVFNEDQPGVLIHPYLGTMNVYPLPSNFSEHKDEGRMVRFQLNFVRYTENELTASIIDVQSNVYGSQQGFFDQIQSFLEDVYDIAQYPTDIVKDINSTINDALNVLTTLKKIARSVDDFENAIQTMKAKILVQGFLDANDLFNDMKEIVAFGTDILSADYPPSPEDTKNLLFELQATYTTTYKAYDPDDPTTTINNLVGSLAIASTLALVTVGEFNSVEDIEQNTIDIFDNLNVLEADDNYSSDFHSSVRNARSALYRFIEDITPELGRIYDYQIGSEAVPAIVISNNIYGTNDREDEIINNNGIQNPFFATGILKLVFKDA